MPGMNMFPGGTTLQIPLDAPAGFTAEAGNAQVTLTWTDPKDKYATPEGETAQDPDQLVSVWDHTVLVRKTGSQPAGPNDGTVVVSSSVRDQYASAGYVDTGLLNNTTYYYGVFAYNADGVTSPGAFASATPIAGTPLSQLAEGTLIKILENGAPVEFYLAKHSYEPSLNGAGRELLVRKDIYDERTWKNSSEATNWASCALRNWLNNEYLLKFSPQVKTMIATTLYPYILGPLDYIPTQRSDAIFSLSLTELGDSSTQRNGEGSVLPISNVLRIAQLNGSPFNQWTRSTNQNDVNRAGIITSAGEGRFIDATSSYGSRPCFTLPATALVDADLNLIETSTQTTISLAA